MSEEVKEMVECPYCAEKINARAKKCRYCGEIIDPALREIENMKKVEIKTHTSPAAPKINVIYADSAPVSTEIQQQPCSNSALPKSKVTYVLLGIFLGCFGAHNFYAGYSGRAVAQLLISILTGWLVIPAIAVFIWAVIEVCIVEQDVTGKKFI